MGKKIKVNLTIAEHLKLLLERLAQDKKISKSKLIEQLLIDYFDEKKDGIFLEKIDGSIREIKQQNKLILSLIDKIDVEKIIKETIEEFVNQAKKL